MIHELAKALEPWKSAFSDSKVIAGSVTGVHILALLFGGGLAIGADRTTLRLATTDESERNRLLADLHDVHRPVLIALSFLFVTGVLLASADVETFLPSPVFWVKLSLIALLLGNGGVLTLTENALRAQPAVAPDQRAKLWSRLRMSSMCSIALWTATAIAGITLVNL